jgi:AcrR family transcriptional regulator
MGLRLASCPSPPSTGAESEILAARVTGYVRKSWPGPLPSSNEPGARRRSHCGPLRARLGSALDAVVAAKIADLSGQLIAAVESASDPVERLLAACRAYVGFGRAHPTHYRIIFERRFLPIWDREQRAMVETTPLFLDAVGLVMRSVQACIDAGQSTGTDAFADTIALWYFVHGMVALPTTITSLPWPEPEAHLEAYVRLLTHLID